MFQVEAGLMKQFVAN